MNPMPPAPSQEKTFTYSWIKWLIKVKDFIEDAFTRIGILETDITTLEATVAALPTSMIKSIQTDYINTGVAVGSGEDARYTNVTITAVADINKCVVFVQPEHIYVNISGNGYIVPRIATGRLTSTTNLRLTNNFVTDIAGRWTVIEYV